MNMPKINEILVESNPWWKTSFTLEYKERDIYTTLTQYISLPQMIALTGLRRVGKTTLLYKIIQTHLTQKFDPKNIIYFSFDEFRETEIREILSTYEKMMDKDIQKGRYLLLLDEIQKVKHWEEQLKRIYDIYGKTIKIIISGSESLFIKKKAKETLAGRLFTFSIAPLTFKEFLRFKKISYHPFNLYEKELAQLYNEYIRTQGFPELIGIKEKEIVKKYIKESIIEKIIYRDIPHLFNIREISVLETILNRQGNDIGTQYRSVIFYHDESQKIIAGQVIQEINDAHIWSTLITTEIKPYTKFYSAENYHRDYFVRNPQQSYCRFIIAPKVAKFRKKWVNKLKE